MFTGAEAEGHLSALFLRAQQVPGVSSGDGGTCQLGVLCGTCLPCFCGRGNRQLQDWWVLIRPFLFLFALCSIFLLNGDCTLLKKAVKCKFHFLLQLMLLLEVALHICECSLKEEEENQ